MEAVAFDWSFLSEDQDAFTFNLSNATLIECLDKYAEVKKSIHPSVVGTMNQIKNHIRQIEFLSHTTISPKHVTSIFYSKFIEMLTGKGLKLSTISNLCNGIRAVLSWSSDYSAVVHPSYKTVDIKKYSSAKLALTADDVSRIYHFNLDAVKMRPQHRKTLQEVRDMFVLGCNLGQRHSDLVRIERGCCHDGKMIILQQKTKNKGVVNLVDMTLDRKTTFEILERYNYEAPYKGDISKYNLHIRELAKIIFGDETFTVQTVVGNEASIKDVPKSSMVSSHTARRTFATYNYLVRKLPAQDVMRATGHTSDKSFHKYICGGDD